MKTIRLSAKYFFSIISRAVPIFGVAGILFLTGCKTVRDTSAGETMTVEVEGLSCPFCLPGVEKNLTSVLGVYAVDTQDWSEGKIQVTVKEGLSVSDEDLRKAVEKAGFTPGDIQRKEEAQ